MGSRIKKVTDKKALNRFESTLDTLINRFDKAGKTNGSIDLKMMGRSLFNLKQLYFLQTHGKNSDIYFNAKRYNIRDQLMADNLVWLSRNIYPRKKIIVWAASSHICRNAFTIKGGIRVKLMSNKMRSMGDFVYREMKDSVYTIGFTAAQGEAAAIMDEKAEQLKKPRKNSLENFMVSAKLENVFLDFRKNKLQPGGNWLEDEMWMRPFGYYYTKAKWCDLMDAIIFTKIMKRSHPIPAWKTKKF